MEKILAFLREKRKILGIAAIALIIVVIGAIAFIAINTDRLKATEDEVTIYITSGEDESTYCVYGTDGRGYKQLQVESDDKATLHILNGRDDVDSIYVFITDSSGETVEQKHFTADDEKWEMTLNGEGQYDVSFVAMSANVMEFYVSNETSFMQVISDERVRKQSVYMMADIDVNKYAEDAIEITYPFDWNSDGHSFTTDKKLTFKSTEAGVMSINNADVTFETGLIICDTPQWEYDIEQVFGEFAEAYYYYIKALRVNERSIDITALYVDSADKIEGIIQYDEENDARIGNLVVPEGVKHVTVAGDYELGKIFVTENLTVEIVGDVDVVFDGGKVQLLWSGDSAPSMDTIERYMNVKSYNGEATDENIGGEGTCELLSGSVKLSKSRENTMIVDGNYIDVYAGYADTIDPADAIFDYELSEEGSATITAVEGKYYCIVTDADGRTRGYKLNIVEKKYNLPIIYIETESGQAITSKETMIPGVFSIDYNGTAAYENLSNLAMSIRGRGNTSWKLDKKPYKIKLDKKASLFGLTKAKEWVLQANHVDKSLIRNKLAMDMGNVLDNVLFTPHAYNVDVYLNGEYIGVYSIVEQIEVKDGRVEGEKDSIEVDTDYLLEMCGDEDKTSFGTNMFMSTLSKWMEVKNPDNDVLTKEQFDYIKNYFMEADAAVAALDGYEEYIDIPSVVDWFLLNEFSYNVDGSFRRSVFMAKKKGDKIYMASYWDYDYAFGNFWRDSAAFDEWICLGNENTQADDYIWTNWMTYLLTDKNFTEQLKARWEEVGVELYNTALATIDEAEASVSGSAEENFIRWPGVLGSKVQYEFRGTAKLATYAEHLQYLRDFINKRYQWINKTIKAM